jgi:hypothetical protein
MGFKLGSQPANSWDGQVPRLHQSALPLKALKFRASWPDPGSYGLIKAREVIFELGPCGKHVLALAYEVDEHLLKVTQTSRQPDDLEPPTEGLSAIYKLQQHENAKRMQRPPRLVAKPGETTTSGWWIFKSSFTPVVMGFEEQEPHKDILTMAEVIDLQVIEQAHRKAYQAWKDRLEVKTFVYKMSDVHGRIEATQ